VNIVTVGRDRVRNDKKIKVMAYGFPPPDRSRGQASRESGKVVFQGIYPDLLKRCKVRKRGEDMIRIRRSSLFAPADRPDRIEKAATMPADVVVVELEDGVAPEKKATAREQAGKALTELDFGNSEVALRVNRIATLDGLADMLALAEWSRKPDLIILPKVESAGEVLIYDNILNEIGADCELMPVVESSRGLQNIASIVTASPRITATSFGGADLSMELGCRFAWEPMFVHRAAVVAAGALAGVLVIDPPFLNIKDETGLADECRRVRELGYTGKICIHPSQIETVNRAFTPGIKEVEQSRKIIKAVEEQGGGAILVDGRMVDAAVEKAARRVIAINERIGMGDYR